MFKPRIAGKCAAVFIAAAILITLSLSAFAGDRELSVDPTGSSEGYSAVLYDNTNGLPTSEANAIVETSEGFIWIGSYSGLIRYDGRTFSRMDSTTGVASVVSLFVDSRDRLWVGTNDSGLALLELEAPRIFNKTEGLRSSSVRAISEDKDGNIVVATTRGLVMIDGDFNVATVEDDRVYDEYIRDIQAGTDGLIYGVTENGAVFTLRGGEVVAWCESAVLGDADIISITPDPNNPGKVYLGTERSSFYYGDPSHGAEGLEIVDVSPLEYINDIEVYGNIIWICADKGIGMIKDGVFTILENIPLNNSIEEIMVDYAGNLWFTSSRQGVMKIVANQFSDLYERYDLPSAVVNATCIYNGCIYFGTDQGLTAVDGENVITSLPLEYAKTASGVELGATDLLEYLSGIRIRSLLRDSAGHLWLSTYSKCGLVCYDGAGITTYTAADGLPADRVRSVFRLSSGAMLAACSSGGVARIENGQVVSVYDESCGLGAAPVLTIAEADNGDIIFGTDGDGIYILRGTNMLHRGSDSGLNSEIVMRLRKDTSHGVYWIVTSNSLAFMDMDYNVTTVHNFPYSNNFDLYENSRGEMWILSSNGIYVVKAEELLANGEINPVFYNHNNGLPVITTANSYSELTETGDLYIAGTTGVALVNIETPFESLSDLKLAVPFLEADGVLVYPDSDGVFRLSSSVKKVTIFSYVFTYSLVNPQVTYRLEGFDSAGVTVSSADHGPVDYTNLPGGSYRFVLELHDSMGLQAAEYSVEIVKDMAITELMWFQILMVIVAMGAVAWLVRLYFVRKTRALEAKAQEHKTFIREIVAAFAKTIDMKDKYTNGHSSRVARYTAMLSREMGYSEDEVEKFRNIALLHDIGKVGIPSAVLNKPGKLTDEEYGIIKSHAALGYNVLKDISIMPELAIGAGSHHERPDGKGYPNGLKGDEIPPVAKIIAVADTFDAMYSNRPYRRRMNFEKVVDIIKGVAGTQLDAEVVDAFLRLVDKGEFRARDDHGGGSTEEIDNIRKQEEPKPEEAAPEEPKPEEKTE